MMFLYRCHKITPKVRSIWFVIERISVFRPYIGSEEFRHGSRRITEPSVVETERPLHHVLASTVIKQLNVAADIDIRWTSETTF